MRSLFFVTLLLLAGTTARAQVGHAPESSPYTDLRARQAASVIGGYMWGSGGKVGVDPGDGPVAGVRYDRHVSAPLDIFLGISGARLQRFVVDPTLPPETRRTGPVDHDLIMMEAGLSLVITGRKTWHGLVPYLGAGFGVAFSAGLGTEFSGFSFGTKGLLVPHAGIKWFPVQALAFKIEGRNVLWRLKYPESFFLPPATAPDTPRVLDPLTDGNGQWTHHPTLLVSLGYTFSY